MTITPNKNEELEFKEKERDFELSQQDIKELTEDKRREEADDRERDLAEGWTPGE